MTQSIILTETNQTLTNADTEYSVALTGETIGFTMQARTAVDVRFAFTTGKVATPSAPYFTLKANTAYEFRLPNQCRTAVTLYLASAVAGTVVEILEWSGAP